MAFSSRQSKGNTEVDIIDATRPSLSVDLFEEESTALNCAERREVSELRTAQRGLEQKNEKTEIRGVDLIIQTLFWRSIFHVQFDRSNKNSEYIKLIADYIEVILRLCGAVLCSVDMAICFAWCFSPDTRTIVV